MVATQMAKNKAGVMGWPIGHSLSPKVHGFWLKTYKIAGSYEALAVRPEELASALRNLEEEGLVGVNLTIPHKVMACKIVNELDATAKRIGAANLVTVGKDGRLFGSNTDAYGFEQNLLAGGYSPTDGVAFVLGAGGASRAVLVALETMGFTEIRLANRTRDHAEKLARELEIPGCRIYVIDWDRAPERLPGTDLLVNATSLGMINQPPLDFPLDKLPDSAFVTDIVYTPLETGFLRRAQERGNRIIDGLGMLLHQARPSFKAFFGIDPKVSEALRTHMAAGRNAP